MDKELLEYENPDNWITDEDSIVEPSRPVSVTVSIRFSREEFQAVDEAAERNGMKATEFIKRGALALARNESDLVAGSPSLGIGKAVR